MLNEMTTVEVKLEIGAIRQLVERIEFDASWDKAGPLYYQLRKLLNEHDEAAKATTQGQTIEILNKVRKFRGTTYGGDSTGMFATFGKDEDGKATIQLTGRYSNFKDVDIKFTEGDTAIYDSYNFDYLGTIEKITQKCVTIIEEHSKRRHRLDLATFANRNYDFCIERSHKRRMEWYD